MSWVQIERKHAEMYGRNFVFCEEASERKFLADAILEAFNFLKREFIEDAFDYCLKNMKSPCERKEFLNIVKGHIGKKITFNHVSNYKNF